MDFEYTHNEKTHTVRIEKNADIIKAVVGDRSIEFRVFEVSPNCLSILSDNSSRIIYAAESENSVYIHVDGVVHRLEKVTDDQNSYSSAAEVYGTKDEVSTPMPGKIVRILVKEGDKVTAKQALVIVESMKMENKITSPVDAEIKSIHFSDGDLVEPGQAIIKLIPSE